jgi:hypothetical protein
VIRQAVALLMRSTTMLPEGETGATLATVVTLGRISRSAA